MERNEIIKELGALLQKHPEVFNEDGKIKEAESLISQHPELLEDENYPDNLVARIKDL